MMKNISKALLLKLLCVCFGKVNFLVLVFNFYIFPPNNVLSIPFSKSTCFSDK